MHIDDDQTLMPDDIAVRARAAACGRALGAIIVDPVWCLGRDPNQPSTDGPATTGAAMRTLRGACDELRVPVFATVGMERS